MILSKTGLKDGLGKGVSSWFFPHTVASARSSRWTLVRRTHLFLGRRTICLIFRRQTECIVTSFIIIRTTGVEKSFQRRPVGPSDS